MVKTLTTVPVFDPGGLFSSLQANLLLGKKEATCTCRYRIFFFKEQCVFLMCLMKINCNTNTKFMRL